MLRRNARWKEIEDNRGYQKKLREEKYKKDLEDINNENRTLSEEISLLTKTLNVENKDYDASLENLNIMEESIDFTRNNL